MGQCYAVNLYLKIKDENRKPLTQLIQNEARQYKFAEPLQKKFDDPLIEGFRRFFVVEAETEDFTYEVENQAVFIEAYFEASYIWDSVITELFKMIAYFLEDSSYLRVYPDSGFESYVVIGHVAHDIPIVAVGIISKTIGDITFYSEVHEQQIDEAKKLIMEAIDAIRNNDENTKQKLSNNPQVWAGLTHEQIGALLDDKGIVNFSDYGDFTDEDYEDRLDWLTCYASKENIIEVA